VTTETTETLIQLGYILAAVFFIFGIKMLGSAKTARRGNLVSALGMFIAVVVTLFGMEMQWELIIGGAAVGAIIGAVAAIRVPMTSMPEFVALFNGTGGAASLFVGWAEFHDRKGEFTLETDLVALIAIFFAMLIGGLTFTGSLVACGKLAEVPWRIESRLKKKDTGGVASVIKAVRPPLDLLLDQKPVMYPGQQFVNSILVLAILACGAALVMYSGAAWVYAPLLVILLGAFVLGVLFTIPIGGADMPVVISLLNSYSGLAACAAGFVISNTVLIVSGSLVGASGIILTNIMCKAMNRSLTNVLFSGFGSASTAAGTAVEGEAKPITADDAYYVLEAAGSVVFVPGYGMAVAQAQHAVRELADLLEENGAEVKYAVHPVAGRMPGHMNVLLAEASVPYEQLVEMEDINPVMSNVDVAIVIGANDVVNPAARTDEASPIYGMPIIDVDKAHTVMVLKRSMRSGFAGVENPLFFGDNTRMLFGDAKKSVEALVAAIKN